MREHEGQAIDGKVSGHKAHQDGRERPLLYHQTATQVGNRAVERCLRVVGNHPRKGSHCELGDFVAYLSIAGTANLPGSPF